MGRTDGKLAAHAKLAAKEKLAAVKHAVEPQAKVVKLSLCSVSFLALAVKTVALVVFYYIFSIGLTFYNKRFVKVSIAQDLRHYMGHNATKSVFGVSHQVMPKPACSASEPN